MSLSATLTERAVEPSDAAAICALLAAWEQVEPVDEAWTVDEVAEELTGPGLDLRHGSVAVLDGDELVGFGILSMQTATDAWRCNVFGGVAPTRHRQGIGGHLVDVLLAQARALRDQDNPGLPGEFKIWAADRRTGTAALAQSRGLDVWRWFFRMRRDLSEPIEAPETPVGYTIRGYRPADSEATRLTHNEAFADHWGSTPQDQARWAARVDGSSGLRREHSYVAVDENGAIAAYVIAEEYEGETAAHGYRTGEVALVGARRAARGHGLASALLGRTLASTAADGCAYSELGVDAESPTGAGRIYQRAGYQVVDRSGAFGLRF